MRVGKAVITAVVDAFHVLVEDLVGALDKFKIAPKGKRKMPGIVSPMQKVIAEKEAAGEERQDARAKIKSASHTYFVDRCS